ncbi:MAG: membrane-bound lytic murein transglycosylase D [Candidatus Latescibacterota bacterium]|jgi:membrane-bound lytic murein transglycosylase D
MLGARACYGLLFIALLTSCSTWRGDSSVDLHDLPATEELAGGLDSREGLDLRAARWHLLRAQEAQALNRAVDAQRDLDLAFGILAELEASDTIVDTTRTEQLATAVEQSYLDLLPQLEHFSPNSPLVLLLEGLSEERIEDLSEDASQLVRIHQLSKRCDITIDANARVAASIHFFQTRGRETYKTWMRRSGRFRDLIIETLEREDLPLDLLHIAMIESGFNPRAYSRARAVGLWQFMKSTGQLEGLHQTHWVDQRRDPIKSTIAAANHLKSLHREFGDWRLAIAAYNSGRGRVRRAIAKADTRDFWQLKLPRETRNYVPLFMAATIISKDPALFGFDSIPLDPPFVYDEVKLPSSWPYVDLRAAARTIGTTEKALRDLNPELRQSITPPGLKKPYVLRLPPGTRSTFLDRYARLPASEKAAVYQYEIQQRDNLSSIAQAFGVSARTIIAANSLKNPNRIHPGQRLYIPAAPGITSTSSNQTRITYAVQRGDSLSRIASRHGVSLRDLMKWNNLKNGLIRPGQELLVWTNRVPRKAPSPLQIDTKGRKTHTVLQGETLWELSRRFDVSIENLQGWNSLPGALIKPGQKLVVGTIAKQEATYTVVKGDTLYSIARKFGLNPEELARQNNISLTTTLLTGTTLKIPTLVD